jgi:hypothetical protein
MMIETTRTSSARGTSLNITNFRLVVSNAKRLGMPDQERQLYLLDNVIYYGCLVTLSIMVRGPAGFIGELALGSFMGAGATNDDPEG